MKFIRLSKYIFTLPIAYHNRGSNSSIRWVNKLELDRDSQALKMMHMASKSFC